MPPSWLQLLEDLPDSIGTAFAPGFLRKTAQLFSQYGGHQHEGASLVPLTQDLLQAEVNHADIAGGAAALGVDPSAPVDFNTYAALLLSLMAAFEENELASRIAEPPSSQLSVSEVVWELARRSLPMIIRAEKIAPQAPGATLGHAGARAQKRQEADIDLRTGVSEFERRAVPEKSSPENWTHDMARLEKLHRDTPNKLWTQREVATLFETLRVTRCGITDIDEGLLDMTGVTSLDVSGNNLRRIDFLPPSLVGLTLNGNATNLDAGVFDLSPPAPKLRVLSLSFNGFSALPGGLNQKTFPVLCALDLCGNSLCDLESVAATLSALPALQHLCLSVNPLALLPSYRDRVLFILPDLLTLDDAPNEDPPPQEPPPSVPVVLIRITVQALRGLPGPESEAAGDDTLPAVATGVVRVRLWDVCGETGELPWAANLVAAAVPEEEAPAAKGKDAKKKGKGVEELHAVAVPSSPPQVIELRLSPSAGLRDAVCFSGLEVAVLRMSAPGDPVLVAQAVIPCGAFLEPAFAARGSCVLHERAPLGDGQVKCSLELNPADGVTALLQGALL